MAGTLFRQINRVSLLLRGHNLVNPLASISSLSKQATSNRVCHQLAKPNSLQVWKRFAWATPGMAGNPIIIPVNDLTDDGKYSDEERQARCKLAALYRVVDLMGWSQEIYNHISFKLPGDEEHILINPYGLHYSEVTAANLVKVDLDGKIIDPGSTNLGVNITGYVIHSAIHAGRKDIKCIIHVHTPAGTAVAAMKCGLLPISGESVTHGDVSYYDYQGISCDEKERKDILTGLGPVNRVMILRNHGLLAMGETIEGTYQVCFDIMGACEIQIKAVGAGLENLIYLDKIIANQVHEVAYSSGGAGCSTIELEFGPGEMEFEAMMRILDARGYKTGYNYKLTTFINPQN